MIRRLILLLASIAAIAFFLVYPHTVASTSTATITTPDTPVLTLINDLRASKGLTPLTHSLELDKSAQEKANDMAARDYFAHDNPEGVGGMYLIPKYLANTTYIGENLAICMEGDRSDAAYKGWFESPTHYDNMVSPDYTLYGIGTAWDNEKNCTVFVNHFAGV